jgi:hypothetical protein
MPRYAITDEAGRFVAARRNIGVGMVLELTEKQAEHELRLGTLVALGTLSVPPKPASDAPAAPLPESSWQGPQSVPVANTFDAPRKPRRSKP